MVNGFCSFKEPPSTFVDEDEDEQELGVSDDHWFFNGETEAFAL